MNHKGLQRVAFAVIQQAVEDYRIALRVKADPYTAEIAQERADRMIADCEMFFLGEWFMVLCDYNGRNLCNLIRDQEHYPALPLNE